MILMALPLLLVVEETFSVSRCLPGERSFPNMTVRG
jgi:hypothetical protein